MKSGDSFTVRPVELASKPSRPPSPPEAAEATAPAPPAPRSSDKPKVVAEQPKPKAALPRPRYPQARPRPTSGAKATAPKPGETEEPRAATPAAPPAAEAPASTPTPAEPVGWRPPASPSEATTAPTSPPSVGSGHSNRDGEASPVYFPSVRFSEMVPGQQLSVTAVFEIGADGSFTVRLSSGSGDPRLDELALKTLRTWRWRPKVRGGQPVSSRVELKVDVVR